MKLIVITLFLFLFLNAGELYGSEDKSDDTTLRFEVDRYFPLLMSIRSVGKDTSWLSVAYPTMDRTTYGLTTVKLGGEFNKDLHRALQLYNEQRGEKFEFLIQISKLLGVESGRLALHFYAVLLDSKEYVLIDSSMCYVFMANKENIGSIDSLYKKGIVNSFDLRFAYLISDASREIWRGIIADSVVIVHGSYSKKRFLEMGIISKSRSDMILDSILMNGQKPSARKLN